MNSLQARALSALLISGSVWSVLLVASWFAIASLDLEPFLFSTLKLFTGGDHPDIFVQPACDLARLPAR